MKLRNLLITLGLTLTVGAGVAVATSVKQNEEPKAAEAADYSSTIRVYVDLTWSDINYVRLGTDQASGAAVLSSSNAKYNQSLGKYVRDISSSSTYDKMGCFFSQSGQWWQYQYDNGYVWISGGFRPGYEYQIKSIGYVSESGGVKYFAATPYEIGEITDNVSNPTVYFVDGNSWHLAGDVYVHYWGGTASSTYPGSAMAVTPAKIHCKNGDAWFDIWIYKFNISGSIAYVQFNNGSDKTGDLRPVDGSVYWYGVDSGTFGSVANYLVSFMNAMGSHTYNGKTYPTSICNLSSASTLVSNYHSLVESGDDVATSIQNSKINTYATPVTSPSGSTADIAMSDLIAQIEKNISNGVYGSLRGFGFLNLNDNSGALIIVIVASLGILSIGAYFFFRKSKKSEE